ncbi:MAG: alpha-L-arabinofuranosidase C-terminal domain-containing protein, partial [Vicinamibacterales bacterium]
LDVLILSLVRGSEEVGVYGAAIRLVSVAMILPDSMMTATFVRLARLTREGDHGAATALFRRTLTLLGALLLPGAIVGMVLAPGIVPLLFGSGYDASVPALQVLVWALLPFAFARAMGDLLIARGFEDAVARTMLTTIAGGALLYVALVPRLGALGAAIGFVATALLLALSAFRELVRHRAADARRSSRAPAVSLLAAAMFVAVSCPAGGQAAREGSIVVRPSRSVAPVSPLLFGAAVEWTDNGNGIFDPARASLREDVLDLLRPLRIPVWRFPGGILSDHYDWRDGVGPRARRPKGTHPMDGSAQEHNFGTDEFIEFCRALNGDALVTANFGTGRLEDALAWQSYFQKKGFRVRYWEIGNEIYLSEPVERAPIPGNDLRIFRTGAEYSRQFGEWARRLRAADPDTLVGAIAGTFNTGSRHRRWIYDLLGQGGREIDFVALHNSFAPLITSRWDYQDSGKRREAYAAMIAHTQAVSFDVRGVTKGFTESGPRSNPRIAITEHFPLFGAGGPQLHEILDQSRTLASAVYTASLLHTWMRDGVWMANYNIAVSKWFGALVTDTPEGLVRTPTYHVYDLYRNQFGTALVESTVSGPTFSTSRVGTVSPARGVPLLDAVASIASDGTVCLAVINRNFAAAEPAAVTVEGLRAGATAEVLTIGAESPNAINGPALTRSTSPGAHDRVSIRRSSWTHARTYSFPPSSITLLRWHPRQLEN